MALLKLGNFYIDNILLYQRRLAAGIDLGTTNSLVATVMNNKKAETLTDEKGRHLLPSVVYYQKENYSVGYDACANLLKDPSNTISSIKRMIGHSLLEIKNRFPNLPYKFQSSENGLLIIETQAGLLNPIRISSDILRVLGQRANAALKGKLEGVVITVPAYFNDAQRQGTKDAGLLAGLHVLRLLNEPTAAAIAYGLDSGKEGIIVVYDLGGGTFDVSILRLSHGIFEVLAINGDSTLGGDDFDHLLANHIRKLAGINDYSDIHIQQKLLNTATATKIKLSSKKSVNIEIAGWKGKIDREQFNNLISPLIKRTLLSCRLSLRDANLKIDDILEIVMVGGSTRIPLIRESVSKFFGRTPLTSIDPDRVVAIGAAIHADILIGNKPNKEMLLLDVIPLSLGLEVMGGLVEKIISRNTTIPIVKVQEFTTFKDNQTAISIHIMQGERELVKDCRSLARFTLSGLPPLPAGLARIRVIFQIDADGLLTVTATEKSTGIEASINVKPSYGLTDKEIINMIEDSINHSDYDTKARTLIEKKLEAARILGNINNMMTDNASVLSHAEHQSIDNEFENFSISKTQ